MRTKVITTKFTCDTFECGVTQTWTHEEHDRKLPEGWGYKTVSGCGLTNYTTTDELCPECLNKKQKQVE